MESLPEPCTRMLVDVCRDLLLALLSAGWAEEMGLSPVPTLVATPQTRWLLLAQKHEGRGSG